MICPFCNKENPNDAVFCKHCGKPVNQDIICPVCKKTCAPGTQYCASCGAALNPAPAPAPQPMVPVKRGMSEKTQKTLKLCADIFLMAAVFLALIFAFFIGIKYRIRDDGSVYRDTLTVWHFFGNAYSLLKSTSSCFDSSFTTAAHYIPVVLSTVIAAGTIISTVIFSLIATVKFGLHFKRSEINYSKYATAAVFSFLLGATLFDCIHSALTEHNYIRLSSTTVAGMVFVCLFIACSLILKTASVGNGFKKKQTLVDCVCTLLGILFLAMVSGFAKSEQTEFTVIETIPFTYSLNFYKVNCNVSFLFNANTPVTSDYVASFVLAVFAEFAQIAILVLTFIALIRRIGNFTEKPTYSLGISIALVAVSAVYLTFCAITPEVANNVVSARSSDPIKLRLAAAPVMALVSSLFHFAVSITHKAIAKKEANDKELSEQETNKKLNQQVLNENESNEEKPNANEPDEKVSEQKLS